jgi:hypothetical protein
MGSYVLYLLTQAFVALIFAYFSGTLVFRDRRPSTYLVSLGLYLLMGSALLEVWGDRGGWEAWALGLNAALVATSAALIGTGALMRESDHMEDPALMMNLGLALVVVAGVMGTALAIASGRSSSVVEGDDILGLEISGGFSHLGRAGWALGAPLFAGAALLIWMGIWGALVRRDPRGFWQVGAGVMFLLWPFHLLLLEVPLSPSLMMMGITMAYFGFQPPKGQEPGEGDDDPGRGTGDVGGPVGPGEDAPSGGPDDVEEGVPHAPWVREAIEGRAREEPVEDAGEE